MLLLATDIPKLREWNVFCFFSRDFGFWPTWRVTSNAQIEFSITFDHDTPDTTSLKKQLKLETTRWHPDKLGRRDMRGEDGERAKSVFYGVRLLNGVLDRIDTDCSI
jgi:hypothetical protein